MNTYFKQIDALRALAVLTVVFSHIPLISGDKIKFLSTLAQYIPGVPLFFCISGFLITLIILNNRESSPRNFLKSFYARRFLRIFPIYYLTILVLFLAFNDYRSWVFYDILYISNIKVGLMGSFDGVMTGHFWSLAVEEQFYLFWPILLIIFRKKEFILISFILILGYSFSYYYGLSFFMARTFIPLCYLSFGGLIAYTYFKKPNILLKIKKITPLIFGFFILFILLQVYKIVAPTIEIKFLISSILIPLIVIQFLYGFNNKILKHVFENKFVIHIGKISYGIYLYHIFAIYPALLLKQQFNLEFLENPIYMQSFKIILTIVIASISWMFFEQKINKLKKYFKYSHKSNIEKPAFKKL